MNIGIVIGVSNYQNVQNLPGCTNDAQAIKQLLEMVDKCDDILYLTEFTSTTSKSVKSELTKFIQKYASEEIEEVIFYFTGHGLFEENQFYYVLSDYEESKKCQTCLTNDELDNLLRSLSANLTIKIVDACQSGIRYVKDPDNFRKYLQESEKKFDKCYFYYSSQNNQSSYQNNEISDFTLAFLNSFADRENQEIRYKDIMDSLADSFSSNSKQTPFFVMQGNYTEVFGFISEDISKAIYDVMALEHTPEHKQGFEQKSLIQRIEEQASVYCNQEQALECLQILSEEVKEYEFEHEINQIFDHKTEFQNGDVVQINTEYLGNYLSNAETNYFVNIHKETRTREVTNHNIFTGSVVSRMLSGEELPKVKQDYLAITGARSSVELPFEQIYIRLESKYPNINDTGCLIFPYLSQTKIVILVCYFMYETKEWNVKQIAEATCEWSSFEMLIKEENVIENIVKEALDNYTKYTLDPILEQFDIQND